MRPRPITMFSLAALLMGLILSPRAELPRVEFDTSFWDLSQVRSPTNATIGEWEALPSGVLRSSVHYLSEIYGGSPVVVEGLLFKPNQEGEFPAIIVMHGSFGRAESMAYFCELLATKGYVALAVSGPGQGGSTGPSETNENRLNVTDGPYYSYYYRLLYSAMRGITFLSELPFVDEGRIAAAGASQGGLESLWLSALDDRLKAVVPIVAGGNFSYLVSCGSFALGHLPNDMRLDDPRTGLLMKYFDPLAYAAKSKVPTLMLVGTSDEFFPLDSFNQTYSSLASPKAMLIVPNVGHFVPRDEWIESAEIWLSEWLGGARGFPEISIVSVNRTGVMMTVTATGMGVDSIVLNRRDGWPWSRWETYRMNRSGDTWTLSVPLSAVDVTLYVSGEVNGTQVVSSNTRLFKADGVGLVSTAAFLLCTFLVILLVRVSIGVDWISSLERAAVWSAIWSATLLPLLIGGGVLPLSLWTLMRTFELWVHPAIPFVILLMLPAGALIAAGSDRLLKALSLAAVLGTTVLSLSILSYLTSGANLTLGTAVWVQLSITAALFAEPLIIKGPVSSDKSIALLFKKSK